MASKRRVKREAQRRTCGSKRGYPDETAGRRALGSLLGSGRAETNRHFSVYRCPHCGLWHVGHTPGRVLQSMRDKRAGQGR